MPPMIPPIKLHALLQEAGAIVYKGKVGNNMTRYGIRMVCFFSLSLIHITCPARISHQNGCAMYDCTTPQLKIQFLGLHLCGNNWSRRCSKAKTREPQVLATSGGYSRHQSSTPGGPTSPACFRTRHPRVQYPARSPDRGAM